MNKRIIMTIATVAFAAQVFAQQAVVPAIPKQVPISSASSGANVISGSVTPIPAQGAFVPKDKVKTVASASSENLKRMKKKKSSKKRGDEEPRDEIVEGLRTEINALRDHRIVELGVNDSTQRPANSPQVEIKTVYSYTPGSNYVLHAGVNRVTDIELQPGEVLTGKVVAGDTVRWVVANVTSGNGENATAHILVKPVQANLSTNFIIATDRHVYHLSARSSGSKYMPVVTWNYPHEEAEKMEFAKREEKRLDDMQPGQGMAPEKLNFSYGIDSKSDYSWKPLRAFDDGSKTYIQMSPNMKNTEAPALFVKEGGELNLVNYRVKGDYYVVDRLFDEAEMKSDEDTRVTIKKDKPWGWFGN